MDLTTTTAGERLMDYGLNRVVAIVDSATDAQGAAEDLAAAGFDQLFDVICGVGGAERIDFTGEEHGALARLSHTMHTLTVEGEFMRQYEQALLAGHCLVVVQTETDDRMLEAQAILNARGGHFINHFQRMTVETIKP